MVTTKIANRFVGLSLVFAFFHWLVLLISSLVYMSRGIHRLDHPEFPVTTVEQLFKLVMSILQQPYEAFIQATHFRGRWLPIALGILNSLLWGAVFASILSFVDRRKWSIGGKNSSHTRCITGFSVRVRFSYRDC